MNTLLDIPKGAEVIDVCKAVEEMMNESEERGELRMLICTSFLSSSSCTVRLISYQPIKSVFIDKTNAANVNLYSHCIFYGAWA